MTDVASDALPTMNNAEFEKVYRRMIELEHELVEFQDSSKDLEQALEDELHDLETQKSSLTSQLQNKDKVIATLNARVISLNTEVADISNTLADYKAASEKTIADLKHKLVAMEISNDDYLSRDRVVESKLQLANQFNNELLEKLAMVENDLDLERQANAQYRLTLSNLNNTAASQPARLTRSKRDSTYRDFAFAESTVLDIGEMLASEPPATIEESKMPRSESLTRFQELCSRSDVLRQKVGEVNSSLAFKSLSTAAVSRPTAVSSLSEASNSFVTRATDASQNAITDDISLHPSGEREVSVEGTSTITKPSRLQPEETKAARKGAQNTSELRRGASKKFKLRNVMKSFMP
ncbi:hypothetical protein OXX59_007115 [Metschnikowia pulcherrima]